MPASVVLAPGLPGMLFNAEGVLAHLYAEGVLAHGPASDPAILPPGITRVHTILAASPALLTEGEMLDGPVLVTPGLGAGGADEFLLGTALPLLLAAEALPRGTRLLLPNTAHAAILAALGLDGFPRVAPGTAVCQLRDALWLEPDGIGAMPSTALRTLRARLAARYARPKDTPARILLQPQGAIAPNSKMAKFLAGRGFVPIVPEALAPDALRDLFLHASMIIGPSGTALANLIFCAPGTTVLELAPEAGFQPRAWLIAEKLGLVHGVLPCPTRDRTLQVNFSRLRALLRMLRITADPQDSGA
jgi:capsular polysaccharide biosynthesis protein